MIKAAPLCISIVPKLKKRVDTLAKKLGTTRSELIRKALIDFINSSPTKAMFKKDF